MKKQIGIFLGVGSFLLWNACATMSVDKARLQGIKKVALVGFTVEQDMPPGFDWSLVGGSSKKSVGFGGGIATGAQHANEMYELLQKKLKTQLKWQITDREQLARIPKYSALYNDKMKGFQNRIAKGPDVKIFGAEGIIEAFPIEVATPDDRMQLAKDLGVDAIVIATLVVKLEKGGGLKMLVGAGEYKPQATLRFAVYDRNKPEAVWSDWNAAGAELEKGADHVLGVTRQDDVNKKVVQAAEYAYERLIEHFKDAKSSS